MQITDDDLEEVFCNLIRLTTPSRKRLDLFQYTYYYFYEIVLVGPDAI